MCVLTSPFPVWLHWYAYVVYMYEKDVGGHTNKHTVYGTCTAFEHFSPQRCSLKAGLLLLTSCRMFSMQIFSSSSTSCYQKIKAQWSYMSETVHGYTEYFCKSACKFPIYIFLALAQEDDLPILKPTNKILIGSAVFPTRETAVNVNNTRPVCEMWAAIQRLTLKALYTLTGQLFWLIRPLLSLKVALLGITWGHGALQEWQKTVHTCAQSPEKRPNQPKVKSPVWFSLLTP